MRLKRTVFGASGRGQEVASSQRGAVLAEFVICFPLVLFVMLAILQVAHIWIAKSLVHYAAFSAARSALVLTPGEYNGVGSIAAERILSWVAYDQEAVEATTDVVQGGQWNVTATVGYRHSLVVPIVGPAIAWGLNPWGESRWRTPSRSGSNSDAYGNPTLLLRDSVTLPKPYRILNQANLSR